MKLSVAYTAQLAAATAVGEEEVELADGGELRDLVALLCRRHGERFTELVCEPDGALRSTLLVILDGAQAVGERGSLALDGVEKVMLMTPIAGG